MYRNYDEGDEWTKIVVTKAKYFHQGKQGSEQIFKYNSQSGRYYEEDRMPDNWSWFQKMTPISEIEPDDMEQLYSDNEDCPF